MIPASEIGAPRTEEQYRSAVEAVRRQSAKRRTEAWAFVPETVLGIDLVPITPAIFTALAATDNAFLMGRLALEHDLRNFVWFCSPQFDADKPKWSAKWRPLQMYRLTRALKRRHNRKQTKAETVLTNFVVACMEVNDILSDTFADGIPSGDGNGQPIAASLEAQLVDSFAREYRHWPLPQPVRHTPIKQLYQLARCIDRRNCGNEARYFDPAEAALDRAFLKVMNAKN